MKEKLEGVVENVKENYVEHAPIYWGVGYVLALGASLVGSYFLGAKMVARGIRKSRK